MLFIFLVSIVNKERAWFFGMLCNLAAFMSRGLLGCAFFVILVFASLRINFGSNFFHGTLLLPSVVYVQFLRKPLVPFRNGKREGACLKFCLAVQRRS